MIPLLAIACAGIVAAVIRVILVRRSAHPTARCAYCDRKMVIRRRVGNAVVWECPRRRHASVRIEVRRKK